MLLYVKEVGRFTCKHRFMRNHWIHLHLFIMYIGENIFPNQVLIFTVTSMYFSVSSVKWMEEDCIDSFEGIHVRQDNSAFIGKYLVTLQGSYAHPACDTF